MVDVRILHNEVRTSLNLINADYDTSVNTVDIDTYLNKAKDYVLENYSRFAEVSKTFENHLRELEITDKKLSVLKKDTNKNIYKLPSDFYDILALQVMGEKEVTHPNKEKVLCKGKLWNLNYVQKDDMSLHDPNWEPSWEWRSALWNIDSEGLLVYHNDKFDITDVLVSYIKDIPDVANPSGVEGEAYLTPDGKVRSQNKHLQISSTILWRKICQIAVFYIRVDINDNYRKSIDEIAFNESTSLHLI